MIAMPEVLTRCGYRCDLCHAYRDNVKSAEDQKKLSDAWFMYYGLRMAPEKIICDGCSVDDSKNPRLIDSNCKVRLCSIARKISSCAQCEDFPCDSIKDRMVDRREIETQLKIEISDSDYENYVKPYENRERLEAIRDASIGRITADE